MIDMRYKPYFLPQVSAPYEIVVDKLNEEGIGNEMVDLDPEELQPMQGIVFADEVGTFNPVEMNPIWISQDNEIIDGHHRYLKALMGKQPIKCIKVQMNGKDASRALNKIQDIYDYEQQQLEEVQVQNTLNMENDPTSGESNNEFLAMLETATSPNGNRITVKGYRQKPIMENSVNGNFFMTTPVDGFNQYDIEFENMLDTNDLGIEIGNQNPIDVLAKAWFPHADFESLSAPFNHSPERFKNRAIVEMAHKMGYDGIKYGDKLIQGLKQ